MSARETQSFSERFAQRWIIGLIAMAVLTAMATFGPSPSTTLFYAVIFGLACSYWFRRRAMYDEQRRNETMEDERDQQIQLQAARQSRALLAVGTCALAVALTFDAVRSVLLDGTLVLPGLLVLSVIAANLLGQLAVVRAYRRDRA